jgi:hypothetical protein
MKCGTKADWAHHFSLSKVHGGKPREPLRTVTELAKDLGTSFQVLGRALQEPGAPQCAINNRRTSCALKARWYRPSEVRAWWKQRTTVGEVAA